MSTNELIARLAAETSPVDRQAAARRLWAAGAVGLGGAALLLLGFLHVRPDLATAATTARFWLKLGYGVALALAGYLALERLARPAGSARRGLAVALTAFAVLVLLGAGELVTAAPAERLRLWLGASWRSCPFNILALSGPTLVLGLATARTLAPTRLTLAGAAAGLFAGGVAMIVYGLYCEETEPAFVCTWYSVGAALTTGLGALLGPLVLRWR